MSTYALKTVNLSKNFWKKASWFAKKELIPAVKHLNLEIKAGESVAFLGPNGAGKSTSIKLICGILKPTEGESWIERYPSGTTEANKCLGLVFGTRSNLWMYITVKQSLEMIGAIYNLSTKDTLSRIHLLAELFEITHFLNSPPNTLSLGERMRCEIVAGLIHRPSILLADEPTIGLDVVGKTKFRLLLKQWQEEEKTTVLLTSHDLSDVEAICNRAILINKGQVGYDGPLQGLKGGLASKRNIKLLLSTPSLQNLGKIKEGIQVIEENGLVKKFQIDIQQISPISAIDYFMTIFKNNIIDISVEEISLESIIAQWYSGEKK
jgi:ABC-2 type transport system ATP-binding protein